MGEEKQKKKKKTPHEIQKYYGKILQSISKF
jgi:hypothetical protein